MSLLPNDVIARIEYEYTDEEVRAAVRKSCEDLMTETLNVGHAQLVRAILFLANGHHETFLEVRRRFYGDPRDVLLYAKLFLDDRKYGFVRPFDQMGPLKKREWQYEKDNP